MRAQLLRIGVNDLADHPLFDDRVTARAQACAKEDVGDIATTASRAIQVIERLAITGNQTLDRDFAKAGIFAEQAAVGIVKDQLDRRRAHRLARAGAGENDIGQGIATQSARGAFAQHPADGIDDVGFAATVGTDDRGHVARQLQYGRIDERLEARQLDRGKTHARSLSPAWVGQRREQALARSVRRLPERSQSVLESSVPPSPARATSPAGRSPTGLPGSFEYLL